MATCLKAITLANLAEKNGWTAETVAMPDWTDVILSGSWKHPDTGIGWTWGAALRWYLNGVRWKLGALDDAGKRVVGGVATRLPDGPEFEYWLGSVKMLEGFIVEPAEMVAWFDEVAPR